jgi:3-hydroxyacyl-CoA dehydrogenase
MFYADTVGLFNVLRSIERFAKNPYAGPELWVPAGLLKRLAAEGKTFNAA